MVTNAEQDAGRGGIMTDILITIVNINKQPLIARAITGAWNHDESLAKSEGSRAPVLLDTAMDNPQKRRFLYICTYGSVFSTFVPVNQPFG